MNFKTTLFLLVALILVGGFVFLSKDGNATDSTATTSDTADSTNPDTAISRKLLSLESANVTRIAIDKVEGKRFVAEKSGSDWTIVEPVKAAAESWAIDSMIRDLSDMRTRGNADKPVEQPRFTVELTANDKTTKFLVGDRTPLGGQTYVQVDGESKADIVLSDVLALLNRPLTTYRKSSVVSVTPSDVNQFTIDRPSGRLRLEKRDGTWEILEPAAMPAETTEVDSIISSISYMSASDWPEGDPASFGLNSPTYTVWFSKEAPATQPGATQPAGTTIQFGRYDDIRKQNVYAMTSDAAAVAKVAATVLTSLDKTALDLRDRRAVEIMPADVKRIAVTINKTATDKPATDADFDLELRAPQPTTAPTTEPSTQASATTAPAPAWVRSDNPTSTVDKEKVDALLSSLNPLRAGKYLASAPEAAPSAKYILTIHTGAGDGSREATHTITLSDTGTEGALTGQYNGLVFEADKGIATKIEALQQ